MPKRKTEKAKYVPVKQGDVVEILFSHYPEGHGGREPFTATVVRVKARYGLIRGTREQSPLIFFVPEGSHKEDACDNSFVTRVLVRAKLGAKQNIFAEIVSRGGATVERHGSGVVSGTLTSLIAWGLAKLNRELLFPLRPYNELLSHYRKTSVGLVRGETIRMRGQTLFTGLYFVHEKQFLRWVTQNASRLCVPKKVLVEQETERQAVFEMEYEEDMDRMLKEDDDFSLLREFSMEEPRG